MSDILKRNVEVRVLFDDELGLKSSSYCYMTCNHCGENFKHYATENIYKSDFDNAIFCSYNCRSKYYKEHQKERKKYLYKEEIKLELLKIKQAEYERKRYAQKKLQKEKIENETENK